jgi:cell wall-associated NlpC family hydrolase
MWSKPFHPAWQGEQSALNLTVRARERLLTQAVQPSCVSTSCRIRFGAPRTPPIAAEAARYAWSGSRPPPAAGIGVPVAVQQEVPDLPNGRRRPPRQWSGSLISIVLVTALMVAGSTLLTAAADPAAAVPSSASDLQRRLEGLNRQADQQVEDYLQAKLAVERTRKSIRIMQQQLDGVRGQLTDARASIAARAAVAYVQGPATDVASLLTAGDPTDVLERAQLLDLLATHDADQVLAARAIELSAQARTNELAAVEGKQAAILDQMAARKTRIEQLVAQTEQTLAELQAAERRRVAAADRRATTAPPASSPAPTPPSNAVSGNVGAVIRYAYAQLGKPYQWGATGPGAFDCSGLTLMAWAQAGVSLPHSSRAQIGIGRQVTRSELQPGDLIFRYSPISHVSLYVGNGQQISATHTGSTVKLQSAFQGEVVGYSRPTG